MIRDDAISIWKAGVAAVHGRVLVKQAMRLIQQRLHVNESVFDLEQFDRILVVGGGKFSHFMAEGLEEVLGEAVSRKKQLSGLVTVPDGSNKAVRLHYIKASECRPQGVNLPTQRVLDATDQMFALLEQSNERTLVIALISGGGSALLEKSKLPLDDIVAATQWLSLRGANILELNAVRIAMSEVKGGGLAMAMLQGTMIGLIVSDVPGDDLRFVSSGPTVDAGANAHLAARDVLERFGATHASTFPDSVVNHIQGKFESRLLRSTVHNFLVGNADVARNAATEKAVSLGYEIVEEDLLAETNTCEQIAEVVSDWCGHSYSAKQCVISIGEPVVEPGDSAGQGGRNQHAVLATTAMLVERTNNHQYCFLSGGTDGEDGNTTAAGAHVTNQDAQNLKNRQPEITDSLKRFDSHPFLAVNGMVFESGPTATNVADLRVLLRGPT